MQNAGLTWTQDLGAVTELLSGEFFQPLGRSSSHQTWSSAMVLTPALRGLFGLDWDALNRTLRVAPNLPAGWERARLRNVPLGDSRLDLEFTRESGRLMVRARSASAEVVCLVERNAEPGQPCRAAPAATHELVLPLPEVELSLPAELPLPGSRTEQLKVLDERRTANRLEVDFEAPGGSQYLLPIRLNHPGVRAAGAQLEGGKLRLRIPAGEGYQRTSVSFTW
jgi:hypothetical protein